MNYFECCHKCKEPVRKPECHSSCKDYIKAKKAYNNMKDKQREAKESEIIFADYRRQATRR